MAWKKNDPNFTNDPRYLEGRVSNVEMQAQINANNINTLMPLLTSIPQINLMPDSGRFGGYNQNPLYNILTSTFTPSPFFTPYNGSTAFINAGKYINNNNNYGGTEGELVQDVLDLLNAFQRIRGDSYGRYGVEFFIAETTMGSGTDAPHSGKYLLTTNANKAKSGSLGLMTASFWLRLRSGGSVLVRNMREIKINGVKQSGDASISTVDGWVHVENVIFAKAGYEAGFPYIYANEGDVVQIALPVFLPGGTGVGVHINPIPTINQYSY